MHNFEITQVGYQTLRMLTRYMSQFIGLEDALELAKNLVITSQKKLLANPLSCPICHELELIGVSDYRQLTIDKYKILYRVDNEGGGIYVTAFMRHKQSAKQLLIDHALLMH